MVVPLALCGLLDGEGDLTVGGEGVEFLFQLL